MKNVRFIAQGLNCYKGRGGLKGSGVFSGDKRVGSLFRDGTVRRVLPMHTRSGSLKQCSDHEQMMGGPVNDSRSLASPPIGLYVVVWP